MAASRFNPRLQNNNSNPIVAVYEEISTNDDHDLNDHQGEQREGPIAVAMNVIAVHRNNRNDNHQDNQQHHDHHPDDDSIDTYRPQPWRHSNLIDLVIGGLSALCSFTTTIKIEITAFLIYGLAVAFHNLAEVFSPNPVFLIFRSILMLLAGVFMFVDSVLLLVSVLITEILGAVALFLCTLFGGSRSGTEWHQFIRRTNHLTRWGFRSCLVKANWKPDRIFPIPESVESASLSGFHPEPSTGGNGDDGVSLSHNQVPQRQAQQFRQYSDDYCARNDDDHAELEDDDITMSTLTTTTATAVASATHVDVVDHHVEPVMISSEHVHVLHDDDERVGPTDHFVDDDTDPFAKSSQRVTID